MSKDLNTSDQLRNMNIRTVLGATSEALGKIGGGVASYRSAALRATILRQNAESLDLAVEDRRASGEITADQVRQEAAQFVGAQRAALASNGIIVDEFSALDLVADTAGLGAMDAIAALNQAEEDAVSLTRDASLRRAEASVERSSGTASALAGVSGAIRTGFSAAETISKRLSDFNTGGSQ